MTAIAVDTQPPRPWRRAVGWLALLAPLFYLTYGLANWLASQRSAVPAIVFGWEHAVPFLAWTIFPYWSINAFYGASLFVCRTRDELDRHGRRLLTAQLIAVTFFVLTPLRFSWPKPETHGLAGFLFDALAGFDKPFNQAPSLHIALAVILWDLYRRHTLRWALWPLHLWFLLICASVLTTYQHHFIDIPTGALLGLICLWLWPDAHDAPLSRWQPTRDRHRLALALRYGGGAVAIALLALWVNGIALWLLWISVSLLLVALAYAGLGTHAFQKDEEGRKSIASRWLFLPYRIGAWINSRAWTRGQPPAVKITDEISLGRFPAAAQARTLAVVDLTAELAPPRGTRSWVSVAMLDLVAPPPAALAEAAAAIEKARRHGPVLVCCALGYSRSAASVATWLVASRQAPDAARAVAIIRAVRPRIVLDDDALAAIDAAVPLALPKAWR
jgi:protein-tyrosine phosphatase